jgi:hypothetical protein
MPIDLYAGASFQYRCDDKSALGRAVIGTRRCDGACTGRSPNKGNGLGRSSAATSVPTNGQALDVFQHHVTDLWRRTLRRRSQKDGCTWTRMTQPVNDWLPKPITLHPWPSDRFAVTHPRWKPYAGKPLVRFCVCFGVGSQP